MYLDIPILLKFDIPIYLNFDIPMYLEFDIPTYRNVRYDIQAHIIVAYPVHVE